MTTKLKTKRYLIVARPKSIFELELKRSIFVLKCLRINLNFKPAIKIESKKCQIDKSIKISYAYIYIFSRGISFHR
jgi:hypothetical protein